jgi:tryptophan-rich sensory protein
MFVRIIIFLIINFVGLTIGGLFTHTGVHSDWYLQLNKAPWTPPGWIFSVAWTTIMICLSVFMAFLWKESKNKILVSCLFSVQWILNVIWSPIFFEFHSIEGGLLTITLLTILLGYYIFYYVPVLGHKALLLLPYFLWMLIATSLNWFIWTSN